MKPLLPALLRALILFSVIWMCFDSQIRGFRTGAVVSDPGSFVEQLVLSPQFQTELRRILVSLIEVAQKLLALNPDAVELFKKANGRSGPQAEAHPRRHCSRSARKGQ